MALWRVSESRRLVAGEGIPPKRARRIAANRAATARASQENLPEGSKSNLADLFVVYSDCPPANNCDRAKRWFKETTLDEEFEGLDRFFKARFAGIVSKVSIRVAEARRISASATEPEVKTNASANYTSRDSLLSNQLRS
jgi:hypothetical protein